MKDWKDDAMCKGRNDLFFPPKSSGFVDGNLARAICAMCPVNGECLDYALDMEPHPPSGIWAGYNSKQLWQLKRELLALVAA